MSDINYKVWVRTNPRTPVAKRYRAGIACTTDWQEVTVDDASLKALHADPYIEVTDKDPSIDGATNNPQQSTDAGSGGDASKEGRNGNASPGVGGKIKPVDTVDIDEPQSAGAAAAAVNGEQAS